MKFFYKITEMWERKMIEEKTGCYLQDSILRNQILPTLNATAFEKWTSKIIKILWKTIIIYVENVSICNFINLKSDKTKDEISLPRVFEVLGLGFNFDKC